MRYITFVAAFLSLSCGSKSPTSPDPPSPVETYAPTWAFSPSFNGQRTWVLDCESRYYVRVYQNINVTYESWGEKRDAQGLRLGGFRVEQNTGEQTPLGPIIFDYNLNTAFSSHVVLNGVVYTRADSSVGIPILGSCEALLRKGEDG
jgi:hypothetical protein